MDENGKAKPSRFTSVFDAEAKALGISDSSYVQPVAVEKAAEEVEKHVETKGLDHAGLGALRAELRRARLPHPTPTDAAARTTTVPPAPTGQPSPVPPNVPRRIGLALSGGGIRSATFALGVLQALAARDKLVGLDYLSTVSGGGYIGSWLTAWIHRRWDDGATDFVQKQLKASVDHNIEVVAQAQIAKSQGANPRAAPPDEGLPAADATRDQGKMDTRLVEPQEITWLRRYSNYLAPRIGVLSTDSLTLVMTWLRNTTLNLVIVVSLLAALAMLAHLVLYVPEPLWRKAQVVLGLLAAAGGGLFLLFIAYNLATLYRRDATRMDNWQTPARVQLVVGSVGLFAMVCAGLWFFAGTVNPWRAYGWMIYVLLVVTLAWMNWVARKGSTEGEPDLHNIQWNAVWQYVLAGFVALVTGGLLFWAVLELWDDVPFAAAVTYGPALFLIAFGICGSVYVGISGRAYYERAREWWSRMNAVLVGAGCAWLLLFLAALYVRPAFDWAVARAPAWTAMATTGWLGSLLTILKVREPANASTRTRQNVDLGLSILTFIAAAGFVLLVALGADYFFLVAAHIEMSPLPVDSTLLEHLAARNGLYDALSEPMFAHYAWYVAGLFAFLVVVFLLFGWRIDVNKFSLHNMYKNRLIRCYLGASAGPARIPHPFIGFDEQDDIDLTQLRKGQRPLHIVNTALNLSQGKNLAWQERKAASFTFSRLSCGFGMSATQGDSTYRLLDDSEPPPSGYMETDKYADRSADTLQGEDRMFTLGSAMATSGAAVSSNMGMNTAPVRAFLVTLFNARLGRWCPNPSITPMGALSPAFGLSCFLNELLGGTREDSKYVYLSDGGHFENLGIYELVRRRCSVIMVVDAAADPERTFQDLGRAIRLCRVDFGAEIDLNLDALRVAGEQLPEKAFAWGTITYNPNTTPAQTGVILYLKPTLTRSAREPIDVQAYGKRNPTFPQQPTSDQFFDEGQFESYRRLGLYVGTAALATPEAAWLPDAVPVAVAKPP